MNISDLRIRILIVIAGALLFVPYLGIVHLFDWDEINFAECAREMIATGDYFSVTINYQPFWEKPPLFIWMQVLSMKLFGVNEFAARFPNAVCGIITLLFLYNIGKKLFDQSFGLLWVLVYAGSFLPHFYFKSGIIDPWFNLFIFSGLYYFVNFLHLNNKSSLLISALLFALAILTKGPVAGLVFAICFLMYWVLNNFKAFISLKNILLFGATVILIGSLWFVLLIVSGNTEIIAEFIEYQIRLFNTQDSGHGGPFLYHWIVLLIGCFPMSVFALKGFAKSRNDLNLQTDFKKWMQILFWVVLILFSIVKTKIVHYSSLCYFPLSFLAVYVVNKLILGEIKWSKALSILLLFLALIIGVLLSIFPLLDANKDVLIDSGLVKDEFGLESLKATVDWSGYEWVLGILFILSMVLLLVWMHKGKVKQAAIGIFTVSMITVNLALVYITPRIEKYSQAAAIEFYESLQGRDCYVETLGFKSYAHLYYSRKVKPDNINSFDDSWLLRGEIDKPVYFVCKVNSSKAIHAKFPYLKELYRKNGFVFFERKPN